MPEVGSGTEDKHAKRYLVEHRIATNLQEVQQEEEIICMDDPIHWHKNANVTQMTFALDEKDDTDNEEVVIHFDAVSKQVDITGHFRQEDLNTT